MGTVVWERAVYEEENEEQASLAASGGSASWAALPYGDRLFGLRRRQPHGDDLGHAGGLHRYAVENIRGFHRPLVMGDDQHLRLLCQFAQQRCELARVHIVQRRLDLIEDAERTGMHPEHRKD